MSHSPFDIVDLAQTLLTRTASVAQAQNLLELQQRCAAALDVIVPGCRFDLVWSEADHPHVLLAPYRPYLALPDQHALQLLRQGQVLPASDGVGYVPIRLGNTLCGWLQIAPAGWSNEQIQALESLAAILAPTVQILLQTSRDGRQPLIAPLTVGHRLRGILELDTLLDELYQIAARLVVLSNFFVALRAEGNAWLELVYVVEDGQSRNLRQFWQLDAGLSGAVVNSGRVICTDNYSQECQQRGITEVVVPGLHDASAWLGVPLVDNDQVLGALCAFHTEPGLVFSPAQVAALQALAYEAAPALLNARRYASAQRQARHLAALNQISRSINSTLDPERVPALIMQQVQELFHVEEGSLLLLDAECGDLVFTYACGPTGNRLLGQRLPSGKGIAGYVVSTGRAEIVNDAQADARFYAETDHDTGFVTRAILAVPLRSIGGVQGVIEVMNRRNGAPFTEEDQRLLEAVADQAVIALENARRFAQVDQALARRAQELDRSNSQLREILRLGNALRAEHRLDDLLRQIAQAVSQSTGFRSAVIALVHRERTVHPYLQRVVAAGPAASAIERIRPVRAPLSRLHTLLRPEFRRGPATYLIDHSYDDYIQLWGGPTYVYVPDLPPTATANDWHPFNALFSLMRNSQGELLGLICIDDPDDRLLPQPEQIQMLEIFANQAAVAIENAHLYAAQEHSLHSMMALNGLGIALNTALHSTEQIFELTTNGMAEMTAAQDALVLLAEEAMTAHRDATAEPNARPVLIPAFQLRPQPTTALGNTPPLLLDLAYRALTSGRLMTEHATTLNPTEDNSHVAWAAIPLRATQEVLGVICMAYAEGLPSAADLEMLTLFASQAAVAVESLRLFNAVREGHDQLASIMESTNEGLLLITATGQVAVANTAFKKLMSKGQRATSRDEDTLDLTPRLDLEALLLHWKNITNYTDQEWHKLRNGLKAIATGTQDLAQGELNQTTPTAHALEWTALRVAGAISEVKTASTEAAVLPLLLVLRDITANKETERLRQNLTHMIVHDLRSPLSSIMASIDMIFKGIAGDITTGQRDILNIANNSAQHLLDMVKTMLDIGRLEGGRMPLDRAPLSVERLIQRAITRLDPIARSKNIRFELDMPADLSPVYADAELIGRVLQNLLDNALKFSPKGSQIVVTARNPARPFPPDDAPVIINPGLSNSYLVYPKQQLCITVRDFGMGIAPEDLERIFRIFEQAQEHPKHAGRQRRIGSGLGLPFCKLVIETHDGRLWVESVLGEGSTFVFTLPIVELPT